MRPSCAEIPAQQSVGRANLASSMRVANPLTASNARAGGNRLVSTKLAPGVVNEAADEDAEFSDTVQNPMVATESREN